MYLLFCFNKNKVSGGINGGINDYEATYETVSEAMSKAENLKKEFSQVVRKANMKVVALGELKLDDSIKWKNFYV